MKKLPETEANKVSFMEGADKKAPVKRLSKNDRRRIARRMFNELDEKERLKQQTSTKSW